LLIDRRGEIHNVIVGDAHRLFLPDLRRHRAGPGRFRGVRLVHPHLRGESLTQDDFTDLALLRLDAMVVIESRMDGLPGFVEWATLHPDVEEPPWTVQRRPDVHGWDDDFVALITDLEERYGQRAALQRVADGEGCITIGVALRDPDGARASLAELGRLAETAGLTVLDSQLQMRRKFDGRYVIGKGKLQQILIRAMQLGAEALVFDRELQPSQLRNIATDTELKVVDRTQLILDIFAQRARSREGKLQVELAQLRYRRPRLAVMPTAMSRLTGGIGGRGPGETKLEINRRRAGERQTRLEAQLRKLSRNRQLRRSRRQRAGLPQVALIGYTNAGKSTLLNKLTRSEVDAANVLFATLDPTSRRLRFPREREVIITDTVGFIRDLPSELVEAFRSTLEEALVAQLILHVVDASSPEMETHLSAVATTLEGLGAEDTPQMLVLNKADRLTADQRAEIQQRHGGVCVSATTGEGLAELLVELERRLFRQRQAVAARVAAPSPC